MIGRISEKFAAIQKENRAALIPFIMGGDPDVQTTRMLLAALPAAGADLIEIGIPFSDPMADGPTVQAAGQRALKAGTKLKDILALVAEFRAGDRTTPVILMGYYNPLYRFGVQRFCDAARTAGVDGVIIVDLPPEEEAEFTPHAERAGLAHIRLIAPTSVPQRLPLLLKAARGFVYYISIAGITGAKGAEIGALREKVAQIRQHTKLPVAAGFGIKTPEQAAQAGQVADAVVVGSALVELIAKQPDDAARGEAACAFVSRLASALRTRT